MHATASRAFSLIELLAAVAVLTLIALLAFPVSSALKVQGATTRCLSNLRQCGMALLAYANDHGGRIPARIESDPEKPGAYLPKTHWHHLLRTQGYLAQTGATHGVHYCPSIPYSGSSNESYGMRRWATPGQPRDVSQNIRVLPQPADFFLLVDSYMTTNEAQGYFIDAGSTAWRIHLRHNSRANTLFADGHVAAMERAYFEEAVSRQSEFTTTSQAYFYWPQ